MIVCCVLIIENFDVVLFELGIVYDCVFVFCVGVVVLVDRDGVFLFYFDGFWECMNFGFVEVLCDRVLVVEIKNDV